MRRQHKATKVPHKAAEVPQYLAKHVTPIIQPVLMQLSREQPADVLGFMLRSLEAMQKREIEAGNRSRKGKISAYGEYKRVMEETQSLMDQWHAEDGDRQRREAESKNKQATKIEIRKAKARMRAKWRKAGNQVVVQNRAKYVADDVLGKKTRNSHGDVTGVGAVIVAFSSQFDRMKKEAEEKTKAKLQKRRQEKMKKQAASAS